MNAAPLAAVCLLAAGGAVVTVLTVIGQAALARLCFRHRIEVIRDEAVTAVLDGTVPLAGPVTRWLAALEAMARHARWRDTELAAAGLVGLPDCDESAGSWPALTPAAHDLLIALTHQTRAAATAYLTWSRPAAWLLPGCSASARHPRAKGHDL